MLKMHCNNAKNPQGLNHMWCVKWICVFEHSVMTNFNCACPAIQMMDGWVRVLSPFNSISVISRRWKGEHERLCAMKRRLGSGRISPAAGFEPATLWSEVGSVNCSATRTLQSHSEGPKIWLSVWRFLSTHCLYKRVAEALARLRGCASSPEPSLLA